MKVLGIDPGCHCGVAVLDDGRPTVVTTLALQATDPIIRLQELWDGLKGHFDLGLDLVVVEGYAMARIGKGTWTLGEIGGVIRLMAGAWQVPLVVVAPMSAKKFATGSGHAEKASVVLSVYKRWRVEAKDDNQADAYILARIGLSILNPDSKDTDAQKEVVAKYAKEVHEAHCRYRGTLSEGRRRRSGPPAQKLSRGVRPK